MPRILSLVGARPQFVKLAPICRAVECLRAKGEDIEHLVVHSGQHYDPALSEVFFEELGLPRPDANLDVGSGPHGQQTGRMMERFEAVLQGLAPDAVIVFGDTNTTLAGALVTAKLGIPLVHLEAGLRSFNRAMPEEINRIATDHISDLLLAPTRQAMRLLECEGLASKSILTGDVNYDAILQQRDVAQRRSQVIERLGLKPRRYVVVTAHRSENAESGRLEGLLDVMAMLPAQGLKVVFPVHPRTAAAFGSVLDSYRDRPGLMLIDPLGYIDMLRLVRDARIVLTDSGGLQKEAFFLDTPCITLRQETEWTETVECGANVLVGMDGELIGRALAAWEERIQGGDADNFSLRAQHPFGDGSAADQSIEAVMVLLDGARSRA